MNLFKTHTYSSTRTHAYTNTSHTCTHTHIYWQINQCAKFTCGCNTPTSRIQAKARKHNVEIIFYTHTHMQIYTYIEMQRCAEICAKITNKVFELFFLLSIIRFFRKICNFPLKLPPFFSLLFQLFPPFFHSLRK